MVKMIGRNDSSVRNVVVVLSVFRRVFVVVRPQNRSVTMSQCRRSQCRK